MKSARRMGAVVLLVALVGGCGGDDGGDPEDSPAGGRSSTQPAQRLGPLPAAVTGSWRNRIGRGEDTLSRTSLLQAGSPTCVRLTERRDTGCYTIEPLRGPGARMWRREGRGRFVEYGPAGTIGDEIVWQVAFEPLGTCTGTTSTFSHEVAGDRLTLRPVEQECKAHDLPLRLVRE